MKALVQGVRSFGPYMMVELLLPGGTLIAAAMWLISRRRRARSR